MTAAALDRAEDRRYDAVRSPHDALLSLQRATGNRGFGRVLARDPGPTGYPWIGKVKPWSAALRSGPSGPHGAKARALADLPRGSRVTVTDKQHGWLAVTASVDGKQLSGYVSQELIEFVRMDAIDLGEITVAAHVPTVGEALVKLKALERRRAAAGGVLKLDDEEQSDVDLAISVLERSGHYTVDHATFTVGFDRRRTPLTQVTTIEDFVLFAEAVEHAYPKASPGEVASELRQLWYSDPQWDILSAGQGIHDGTRLVDIESDAPVATSFDMKQIAPKSGGLQLDTRFGRVDIGHVMAGIDLALNGFPASYPKGYLKSRHDETWKEDTMYDFLKDISGGHTADFATWAGDIGQAYAEYLLDRYVRGQSRVELRDEMAHWSPDDQILGDIHGYYAVAIWKAVPFSESPTGSEMTVSNILRDLYLTPHSPLSYGLGKSGTALEDYVTERSLGFASLWFAGKAYGEAGYWSSTGVRPTTVVQNYIDKFWELHRFNEAHAEPRNKLETIVKRVAPLLTGTVQ